MNDRRTLLAFKLRTSRRSREAWLLAALMLVVFIAIATVAAIQLLVCSHFRMSWTVKDCLMPWVN